MIVQFKRCQLIRRLVEGCTSVFDSNTLEQCILESRPQNEPHYYVISHRCGYGDDINRYCFEHDFCHHFVNEYLFLRNATDGILYKVALGETVPPEQAAYEEVAVQVFQRWLRANEEPIVGGINWVNLKQKALEMLGDK